MIQTYVKGKSEWQSWKHTGGVWPKFGLFACLIGAPELSCPVLTGWHHHLLISSRSLHRLTDKAVDRGDSWQWGFGSVVQLLRLCLLSVVSEQHPIKSQLCHSGFSESERKKKKKKVWGQRENRRKRRGRGEGRSDELSVAWEEGRAQGYDWLQARSEFKANAQARARCKVGRKGGYGAQRGVCKQERQVLVKESLKKKEKKKNPLKGFCYKMTRFVWCPVPSDVGY